MSLGRCSFGSGVASNWLLMAPDGSGSGAYWSGCGRIDASGQTKMVLASDRSECEAEAEHASRQQTERLCADLRARGDALSDEAAAEIEGGLDAFVAMVEQVRTLRRDLTDTQRNHDGLSRLWARVPSSVRIAVVHGEPEKRKR